VAAGDDEAFRLVRRDEFVEIAEGLSHRLGRPGSVDKQQPVPVADRQFDQSPPARIEARRATEALRTPQVPGQGERPGVIGADDRRPVRRLAQRQQLVTAVPAEVRECVDLALVVAAEQNAGSSERNGSLIPGTWQVCGETRTGPASAEEVPPLPVEHAGIGVRGRRQHATVTERPERIGDACRVKRGPRAR